MDLKQELTDELCRLAGREPEQIAQTLIDAGWNRPPLALGEVVYIADRRRLHKPFAVRVRYIDVYHGDSVPEEPLYYFRCSGRGMLYGFYQNKIGVTVFRGENAKRDAKAALRA